MKILAPGIAHDPEAVERFKRKARAIASLGHTDVLCGAPGFTNMGPVG